ncbi:hypothetical protein V6N13_094407 [Hibiscus sabdariffa]
MAIKNGPQGSDINRGNKDGEVIGDGDSEIVVEDINETNLESSESEWDNENHLVSDDKEEEILSIKNKFRAVTKKIKNKTLRVEDLGPAVALKSASHFEEGNENALGGLGSGEDTDYLDTSNVGSYETNSYGDFISKNTGKVFFDDSTIVSRFELGMVFKTQQQLKDALYAYAVANRFDFKYVSNRKEKTRVVCKKKGCHFVLHASWDKSDGFYKIKTLVTEHQCSVTFQNKRADFKLVGKHFLPIIRIVPKLNLVKMQKLAKEELKVDLKKKNLSEDPGGTFELIVERPTAADIPNFKRLYVCFSALKEGFKKYCRPAISLDECFLKGPFKGEILSGVGRDSNNQIFPIAWAVVEVENRDIWAWFLKNIQYDLQLGDGEKFTLISDMQKSTDSVLGICMPIGKKVHKDGHLQLLFWACCKATTQPQFHQYSARIGELKKKAFDDLMEKDPRHWSKAFFPCKSKCDALDNNFSEAFNYAILGTRFKSIISLFEEIRHYVINRLVDHKKRCLNWKGGLYPRIEKKLEEHKASSAFCHVIWNEAEGYEVMCKQDTFVVNVRGWNCTCRVWDLTGIPCPHAVEIQVAQMESNVHSSVEGSINGSLIAVQSTPPVQSAPLNQIGSSTPRKKVTSNRRILPKLTTRRILSKSTI